MQCNCVWGGLSFNSSVELYCVQVYSERSSYDTEGQMRERERESVDAASEGEEKGGKVIENEKVSQVKWIESLVYIHLSICVEMSISHASVCVERGREGERYTYVGSVGIWELAREAEAIWHSTACNVKREREREEQT